MTGEAWDVDHPVLTLLRQRREEGSKPGRRSDDAKLGLAVEGGGMRGVVSAAMLTAIDDLGFADAIDEIYSCSSGSINSAYHLAGETWYPLTIYFDDLTTPKFVDLRRAFTKKPILNLDYAFQILSDVKPLDYEYVVKSPIKLNISITLVDELQTIVVADFESVEDLREALRASSWLPVAIRGAAVYKGKRAVDGGVLTALPFRLAVQDNCTHILSLSTHAMDRRSEKISLLNKYTKWHLNNLRPGLGNGYIQALHQKHADQRSLAKQRFAPFNPERPSILDLAPLADTPDVKRHELAQATLIAAARTAYEVMYAALARKPSISITNGLIRAIPRFAIAERAINDSRHIQLFDRSFNSGTPWGISRVR
jgi:predicted patatin/cPLA2 family phospholipase